MAGHPRRTWRFALAGVLGAALAGPAAAQPPSALDLGAARARAGSLTSTPMPVPGGAGLSLTVPAGPTSPIRTQDPTDPGLSSRPPGFTLPSGTPPAAKDPAAPAAKDPTAPAVTNDAATFPGFAQVQATLADLSPGNFKDTKYKWYGFVRLDGIYDFHPMGSTDSFVTATIPIPQGKGQNAVLTPRYTRLGFDTLTPLKDCYDWEVKTRIELDFFNGNTSGAFGSFPLRLRFAWIDVGPFLVGQAASLFMDYDAYPNVLDYQGPPGMMLMRQPIAAVRIPLADNLKLAIGVEQPYSDIQWQDGADFIVNPGNGIITDKGVAKNIQNIPDLTANVRYKGDYGHLQVAGILRKLTYQPADEQQIDEAGYGVNVTGTFHPWAMLHGIPNSVEGRGPWEKSRFLGQYACGRGVSRYLNDANGLGLDASFDTINRLRVMPATGWFIAYEQWWTDKLISNFSYGRADVDLTDTLPATTYKAASYGTANLIYFPVERLGMGVEFLYGGRENKDGARGKNYRIQTGVQYRF